MAWRSNRYSVPWQDAGAQVSLRERAGQLEIWRGPEQIAVHQLVSGRHQIVRQKQHHADIPLNAAQRRGKGRIQIQVGAPQVEVRPLAAYESAAAGGVR